MGKHGTQWIGWGRVGMLTSLVVCSHVVQPAAEAQASAHLRRQTEAADLRQPVWTKAFYERRDYRPAWLVDGQPGASAVEFARSLPRGQLEGLEPGALHRAEIEALLDSARAADPLAQAGQGRLDVLLTDAFMEYGAFLLRGRIDPRVLHSGWDLRFREADVPAVLDSTLRTGHVEDALARLAPPDSAYGRLSRVLAAYHRMAARGGWEPLGSGPSLRRGDSGEGVRALRERLRLTDDQASAEPDSLDRFDAALEDAVRAFQARYGLEVDGIVGRETRAALDVPVEARIRQIVLNLERLRWLPLLPDRRLMVNVAGYDLRVFESDTTVLEMRVIVGKLRTPTPVFSARLTEVVLAPYWDIPASIVRNEILPQVRRDAGYLSGHQMTRLPSGLIRQAPGPSNPLGRVKFIIPNRFGVGLHDTPEQYLFAEHEGTFSHGCIRIERPFDLAMYVLRADTNWTREQMEAVVERWQETGIPVAEPLPVYVLYRTAWVDREGRVQFRPDRYGHDARLDRALQARSAEIMTPR